MTSASYELRSHACVIGSARIVTTNQEEQEMFIFKTTIGHYMHLVQFKD